MKSRYVWTPVLATLLALPLVHAAVFPAFDWTSLSRMMGSMWNMLGSLFSFEYVSRNPAIMEGILKFLVFILVLRVVQVVCKNYITFINNDNKTSGIIGFVVAIITVIFTPNTFLFSSLVALLVPLLLIGGLVYVTFKKLKGGWLLNFFGVIVMLIAVYVTNFTITLFKNWKQFEPNYMAPFVMQTLDLILMVVFILFVVKLIMMFFDGTGTGEAIRNLFNRGPGEDETVRPAATVDPNAEARRAEEEAARRAAEEEAARRAAEAAARGETPPPVAPVVPPGVPGVGPIPPNPPRNVRHTRNPETSDVEISWTPPEGEMDHYIIQRRVELWTAIRGNWWTRLQMNMAGGWVDIGTSTSTSFVDDRHPTRRWFNPRRWTDYFNSVYHPGMSYEYRVAAVSSANLQSHWSASTVVPPDPAYWARVREMEAEERRARGEGADPEGPETDAEIEGQDFGEERTAIANALLAARNAITDAEVALPRHRAIDLANPPRNFLDLRADPDHARIRAQMEIFRRQLDAVQDRIVELQNALDQVEGHPRYREISRLALEDYRTYVHGLREVVLNLERLQNIDAAVIV
jgi:hypothetical protein